jgi:hypothetical protein
MAKTFDELLSGLHTDARINAQGANVYNLTINDNRQFVPAEDFNTTIAFEGDINTAEIIIDIPITYARHELS